TCALPICRRLGAGTGVRGVPEQGGGRAAGGPARGGPAAGGGGAVSRLTRGRVVLAVLLLGALGFGISALPWASAEVPTALALRTVTVSGGDASPVTTAASLAVLATGLAVALGGRWVTRVCAVALVVLGGALGAAAIGFLGAPRTSLETAAAQVSGV